MVEASLRSARTLVSQNRDACTLLARDGQGPLDP
jgi:hypothetical protein